MSINVFKFRHNQICIQPSQSKGHFVEISWSVNTTSLQSYEKTLHRAARCLEEKIKMGFRMVFHTSF